MNRVCITIACLAALITGGWSQNEQAPALGQKPAFLQNVGIDQKIDSQIPLDLTFKDEHGQTVKLGDFFGKRPVVLTLVYYGCPSLCTLVLNDLTRTLNAIDESAGQDFEIVTVSFNPNETPTLAAEKKAQYLRAYHRPMASAGWHFLTGDEASIRALTDAVGFRYTFDPKTQQYVHASGIMVATPSGKLARYLFGVEYTPRDVKLALTDAARGQSARITNPILYYCFQYDEHTGRYTLSILRLIRLVGVVTVIGLGGLVFTLVRRGSGGNSAGAAPTGGST